MTLTMHNEYPKRLIEVDLPIARISAHARREKSIRHGHISTLHIWWARRPLAACRAVICASLWPDPVDLTAWAERGEAIPVGDGSVIVRPRRFLETARERMTAWANQHLGKVSKESYSRFVAIQNGAKTLADPLDLQRGLLDFIADFANWDNSTDKDYLETARALTQAAHEALGGESETRPLVVDPFCGGGSIPLEALRVGADAFASDLNPIPVLLNKVVLEYIPKYGQRLADEVRKWGAWIKQEAEKELAEFYPKDPDGATPIAYLWARTVRCEGPGCGAEIPLLGCLWLSRKKKPLFALQPIFSTKREITFNVVENPASVAKGFTNRNKAVCPVCEFATPTEHVRQQLLRRSGGSSDAKIVAVITSTERGKGVRFRTANQEDVASYNRTSERLSLLEKMHLRNGLSLVPDEDAPPEGALGYRFQRYGITKWRNLYSDRQLVTLATFTKIITSDITLQKLNNTLGSEFAGVIQTLLGLAVGRLNDRCSTLCRWEPDYLKIQAANGGQNKMPMLLDFVEVNPFGERSGNWSSQVSWIAEVILHCSASLQHESNSAVVQSPAQLQVWSDNMVDAIVTDPPYYDAFGYSDLSEYFYIWLRRTVGDDLVQTFSEAKPPKKQEAIAIGKLLSDRGLKDKESYLSEMRAAFKQARKIVKISGVVTVVFASKSTSAWETILSALMEAGWIITSSWPIDTEMAHRTRALGSAALNSSIHITCRPRETPDEATQESVGDWRDVLAELPQRIHSWMPRLAEEGVVGADAIFACLGPALEIFSRYSRVEKSSGESVTLGEYLEHVWAAVSKEALSMIFKDPDTAGLEPDARLTAMWLWTLGASSSNASANDSEESEEEDSDEDSSKAAKVSGFTLEFDAARKIAQGLGVHLEKSPSVVEVKGDTAKLLSVAERVKYLFGKDAETTVTGKTPRKKKQPVQQSLFTELQAAESAAQAEWGDVKGPKPGITVLDRLHQAMVLFAAGRGEAMKRFLVEEGIGNDARFWKLAQSLTALYPGGSDEKRWVDGVLARKKGLGF